ncbi:MAG: hypothetical protein AABM42_11110 [Actinomycetota bacterium]
MASQASKRRISLAAAWTLVALAAGVAPSTASAAGHTYTVIQCHPLNRAHADAILEDAPAYATRGFCGDPQNDYAIKVTSTGDAQRSRSGRVRWPTGSPHLALVSVDLQAKLRRDSGHAARLWMADRQQNEVARVARGDNDPTGYRHYTWNTQGHGARQFIASLACQTTSGCPQSDLAKTWVRNVRLKVADYSDPAFATLDGTLLGGGWLRGTENVRAQAEDSGSGIGQLIVTVNDERLAIEDGSCDTIPGTSYAARFSVCAHQPVLNDGPSTSEEPFHDGQNTVSICAVDFAGNRTCDQQTVHVDNTAPALKFMSSQDPDDPELVRAAVSDGTSGVRSGQIFYRPVGQASWRPVDTQLNPGALQARIDSTIDPPGNYEFMARASDAAGNVVQTTTRADGQPMILAFPLKSGVKLSAHLAPGGASQMTIGYGHRSKVAGRLVDASGQPLAHQELTVIEHFPDGALINRRVRSVETDSDGLWGERLPPGPSRRITASFDGTQRYLPDDARAGRLRVKTKTTFHLSRSHVPEGRRVVFRGRVAHLAARIPAGGKLIELQVRDGSRWETVRQTFYTRADGRYKLRYRFARFYTSDVAYRFRIKVLRERGWPYKAPAKSRSRKLVVKAR